MMAILTKIVNETVKKVKNYIIFFYFSAYSTLESGLMMPIQKYFSLVGSVQFGQCICSTFRGMYHLLGNFTPNCTQR